MRQEQMGRLSRSERDGFAAWWEDKLFTRQRLGRTPAAWFQWALRFAQDPVATDPRSADPRAEWPRRLELAAFALFPTGAGPPLLVPSKSVRVRTPDGQTKLRRMPARIDAPTLGELVTAQMALAAELKRTTSSDISRLRTERVNRGPALVHRDRWAIFALRHFRSLEARFRRQLRQCKTNAPTLPGQTGGRSFRCGQWFLKTRAGQRHCSESCRSRASSCDYRDRKKVDRTRP
jgi:hypothetical protein